MNIKCVFWSSLQLLLEKFLILRKIQRDINVVYVHVQYPVFLSDFNPLNPELNPICYLLALLAHHFLHVSRIRVNEKWIFSTDFGEINKYKISWQSVRWEPSCAMRTDRRTDGQTDVTKLIVAFRKFSNARKKCVRKASKTEHLACICGENEANFHGRLSHSTATLTTGEFWVPGMTFRRCTKSVAYRWFGRGLIKKQLALHVGILWSWS